MLCFNLESGLEMQFPFKSTVLSSLFLSGAAASFALSGCGGGGMPPGPTTQEVLKVSGKADLKKRLESVAESGAGGSGLAGISDSINELKATDSALAEALMKDYHALEQATQPNQIKPIAKRMAEKL